MKNLPALLLLAALAATGCSNLQIPSPVPEIAPIEGPWPGPRADGSVLLPNGWSLRPVGRQIRLADFPVNVAVHPGGKFAAALHAGYSKHEIIVVDVLTAAIVSRTPLEETFYGLEFSRDGRTLFASGAGTESLFSFTFADGKLTEPKTIQLRNAKERAVPAGLALASDAQRIYVANVWGHRVSIVDLTREKPVQDILLGGTNALAQAVAGPADFDTFAATKRATANESAATRSNDPFPYACRLDEKRQRLYVSLWAQAAVAVIDLRDNKIIARLPTEEHPCEMLLNRSGTRLFVANAARNTVTIFDTESNRTLETLSSSLHPDARPGSTPNSLALAPDEETLFVANADNNNVAVFDVATAGKSRPLGFIPVGWYPTSVRVTPDGKNLLVANGKGLVSKANPKKEYIGSLMTGSLSVIPIDRRSRFESQLAYYTALAYRCSPLKKADAVTASASAGNPIPTRVGAASPIKYCFYVIKENRTYDQVLGDLPQGNGDPKLCLFPERVTPNHHKLAREFVLLDNFYVESEVSADGHEWSMGAYATDFVEKFWPLSYGHNKKHSKYPYPAEGSFPIAEPAGGYLWDRAKAAGVSYRSYGEFVANPKKLGDPARAKVPGLAGAFDPYYRSFDMEYPDVKRVERFVSELKRFEQEGDMPRLQIVRLPNDHTHGATLGKLTPTACVADNDLAFGQFVEAVSRSKFWPQTAIFVVEDDAQNGPDHVDAHRTIAFVISPYTKRRAVDSTLYSTSSMLRSMELILGLAPMTQFDSAATPMFNSFTATPDFTPYQHLPANVDLNERNKKLAWGSDLSEKMNFAKEDAADDLLLNEIIWRNVRGTHSPMPAPVRAAFVFAHPKGDDDDD